MGRHAIAWAICAQCGKDFPALQYRLKMGKAQYCAIKCAGAARRGIPVATPERFWRKVERTDTCWIWMGAKHLDGYGMVVRDGQRLGAHRYAWSLAGGVIPEGFQVLHTCDIRPCVRNDDVGVYVVVGRAYERRGHLWLGTHEANMADMAQKDRARMVRDQHGESNKMSRLTDDLVREARILHAQGWPLAELSRRYSVTPETLYHVVRRKTWKHVV